MSKRDRENCKRQRERERDVERQREKGREEEIERGKGSEIVQKRFLPG